MGKLKEVAIAKVDIGDVKTIDKALKKLPLAYQAKILRAVNRQLGKIPQRAIIQNAPHRDHRNARVLASRASIIIAPDFDNKSGVHVGLVSAAYWGRFVNYGTAERFTLGRKRIRAGVSRGAMKKNDFFDRGIEQSTLKLLKEVNKNYSELTRKQLEKTKNRKSKKR